MPIAKPITKKQHEAERIQRAINFSQLVNSFTASPVVRVKRRLSEILRDF